VVTECCSESWMRSRTSRGVPEWSRGEELYIGSPVSAAGKVSGVTGIVPGPPEGSQGSTGWGHLSRRAPWAKVEGEPAPGGLVCPPWASPAPRVGNPRGGGAPHLTWGASPPLEMGSQGAGAPLDPYIKRGEGGQPHPKALVPPSPLQHLSLSQKLGEALP